MSKAPTCFALSVLRGLQLLSWTGLRHVTLGCEHQYVNSHIVNWHVCSNIQVLSLKLLQATQLVNALLVVLKCTDAINPFGEIWGKERLRCFAQPVLTCPCDVERFKHDSNFVQVLSSPAVLQLWVLLVSMIFLADSRMNFELGFFPLPSRGMWALHAWSIRTRLVLLACAFQCCFVGCVRASSTAAAGLFLFSDQGASAKRKSLAVAPVTFTATCPKGVRLRSVASDCSCILLPPLLSGCFHVHERCSSVCFKFSLTKTLENLAATLWKVQNLQE